MTSGQPLGGPRASSTGSGGGFGSPLGVRCPAAGEFGYHFVVQMASRTSCFSSFTASIFYIVFRCFLMSFEVAFVIFFRVFSLLMASRLRA